MNRQYIFTMESMTKKHGQKEVLKDIWLSFYPGAKIGVLGANGAGKSTLLRIMAGQDKDFDGTARLTNGFTAGYLPQEPQLNPDKDVQGNVQEAVATRRAVLDRFTEITEQLGTVTDDAKLEKLYAEMARLQDIIDQNNLWELDRQIEVAMSVMNLPPGDADVTKLSGGERRRVALCKLLIEQPDLLLLDEPTNHLDAEAINWLEQHLAQYPGTVVAVTHDRYFLDNVAQWILELDRGQGHPFEGNYSSWLEQKQARLEREQRGKSVAKRLWRANWNGFALHRKLDKPRAKRVLRLTKSWRLNNSKNDQTNWNCRFHQASTWANWSSKLTTSPRALGIAC